MTTTTAFRFAILFATFGVSFLITHQAIGAEPIPERFMKGERRCKDTMTRRHFLDSGFFHNDPQIFYYHYCVPTLSKDEEREYKEQVKAKAVPFTWDKRFGNNVVYDFNRLRGWVEVRGTDPKRRLKYQVYVNKGQVLKVIKMTPPKRKAVLLTKK